VCLGVGGEGRERQHIGFIAELLWTVESAHSLCAVETEPDV